MRRVNLHLHSLLNHSFQKFPFFFFFPDSLLFENDVLILVLLFVLCAKQILSLVPELVNVFAQVVSSPVEASEVKALVGRAFSHLISLYGHQMQPLLSNLSPAHANALAAFSPKSWCLIESVNYQLPFFPHILNFDFVIEFVIPLPHLPREFKHTSSELSFLTLSTFMLLLRLFLKEWFCAHVLVGGCWIVALWGMHSEDNSQISLILVWIMFCFWTFFLWETKYLLEKFLTNKTWNSMA